MLVAGALRCPLCEESARTFATVPPLMRHVTVMHSGVALTAGNAEFFQRLDRGTCTTETCGGFRRLGQRACNRCSRSTPVRPPKEGDVIAGPTNASHANLCDDSQTTAVPNADGFDPALFALSADAVAEASSSREGGARDSTQGPAADAVPSHGGSGTTPQPVLLVSDFTTRVRQLPPNTIPRIP
eukprot:8498416-Karenia_brevis.AAC.1